MYPRIIDEMVAREQRKDEMKRVEAYRLELLALSARESRNGIYQRLLVSLGARMVAWGNRLLERYDDLSAHTAAQTLATNRPTPCP